jgi:hypothetical protein
MSKRIQLAVFGAAALLAVGAVAAEEPWKYAGGEAAWVLAPSGGQQPAVGGSGQAAMNIGDVSEDGWRFVGGEAGWVRESHRYEFANGTFAHAHSWWCVASHDRPAPSKIPLSGEEQRLFGGA